MTEQSFGTGLKPALVYRAPTKELQPSPHSVHVHDFHARLLHLPGGMASG